MNSFPFFTWIVTGLFALIVGATLGGALIAVFSTRLVRSVCGLALCAIGLAGLFYFLRSPFLALMEILIYVGAVCVTVTFAVMLAEADEPPREESRRTRVLWGGGAAVASGLVFIGLAYVSVSHEWPTLAARVGDGSVEAIGLALLTTYSMAFELISLILFVAILGALALARPGRAQA